jgi:hypothetical protein
MQLYVYSAALPALLRKQTILLQLRKITTHTHELKELLRCSFDTTKDEP